MSVRPIVLALVVTGMPVAARAQEGATLQRAAARAAAAAAAQPSTAAPSDPVWEGALLGAGIGFGAGMTNALLADCPSSSTRGCPGQRVGVVALTTAVGALIGWRVDVAIRPDSVGVHLPGPPRREPAAERRPGAPGVGLRAHVRW